MWNKPYHLLHNVDSLHHRVNNLSIKKRKTLFALFKVKQRNVFKLVLIDTGNLVHSAIVSGESKGGKISSSMDFKVGTAYSQIEGFQVLGVGEPWPIYLEGMEESYILEPQVIWGLSHSVNLGISFLTKHKLKLICTEEEFPLMPVKDVSASRVRLVYGGCHSFKGKRMGRVLKATEDQMIWMQVWRIPHERISNQYIKQEAGRGPRHVCKGWLFISRGNGKINPSADESWDYRRGFNWDQW